MRTFKPRVDSLPGPQQRLWRELGNTPREFVLYGGTALALQLGHRQSQDFDFFSSRPFSAHQLLHGVPYLKAAEILQREDNTLTCAINRGGEIKVSFFGSLQLGRVQEPLQSEDTHIHVASMLDIAASKLAVIQRRPFYRDYFDICTLLNSGIVLADSLGAARAVYGPSFDPKLTLRALTFFEDGDLERLPPDMRSLLIREAQKTDINSIPSIRRIGDISP